MKIPAKAGRRSVAAILLLLSLSIFCSCLQRGNRHAALKEQVLQHGYWKKQALTEILPPWTRYAVDSFPGSFFSTLDANWKSVGAPVKFPSMIARHLFSYSVAYLLSGKDEYITMAGDIKRFLITHAWDSQHGGWFNALNADNTPQDNGKSTFVQVYVITGLAMYYFVTHDAETLKYIDQSNELLEEKIQDNDLGGYYDEAENDWTLKSEVKSFASQLAPVSGYLGYLYLATGDKKYLDQAERIADTVLRYMQDVKTGWVLESFDQHWRYLPAREDEEEINIGHNIETAWMLLRLHLLNNRTDYRRAAETLSDSLHRYGFNAETGFWYSGIDNQTPGNHNDYTYWWIQAYGNMFDLCLARVFPEKNYDRAFVKGAGFWDTYFLDKAKGDTHFSVLADGRVKDYRKANQFKSSYHSMGQCMLNYFYLACWFDPQPFTVYFKITSVNGEALHPLPIEMSGPRIKEVRVNGQALPSASHDQNHIVLPALNDAAVEVSFY